MKMLVLKNPDNGELVCVPKFPQVFDVFGIPVEPESDPHEGWEVLEERDGLPPPYADFIEGRGFVVDLERRAKANEQARVNSLSREEFMAEVEAKVQEQVETQVVEQVQAQAGLGRTIDASG